MTAYRQGERQEVPRQGGHGRAFAFNASADLASRILDCTVDLTNRELYPGTILNLEDLNLVLVKAIQFR